MSVIKSHLLVNAETVDVIDMLECYNWPAHTKFIKDGKVFLMDNQLQEGGFEDQVTGIAMFLARSCPGKMFSVVAKLHSEENYYIEKIVVECDGSQLTVNIQLEDQMFKTEKKCVRCEHSLEDVYSDTRFVCPHCQAVYKHTDEGNPFDADYVFGSEEFTYTIPHEHI